MLYVPIKAEPYQSLQVVLNQQNCDITIRLIGDNLYFSLGVNGTNYVTNKICRHGASLVTAKYLGFFGDFVFIDLYGNSDPVYTELNERYFLVYVA